MSATTMPNRLKLDGRKVDTLIGIGMQKFGDAGIYISPSKMSKLVKDSLRRRGFDGTRWVIDEYFKAAALLHWESYAKALGGTAIYSDPARTP